MVRQTTLDSLATPAIHVLDHGQARLPFIYASTQIDGKLHSSPTHNQPRLDDAIDRGACRHEQETLDSPEREKRSHCSPSPRCHQHPG
eukprot:353182-Chlamydomonas_euryale.AAC.21